MTDSEVQNVRPQGDRGAYWKHIVVSTFRGLEQFSWNLAWFTVLIFLLFSFILSR
jgi:hypothetical protein